MDERWARGTLARMLVALNGVIEATRGQLRDEFLRDERLHFQIMQGIVILGMGVDTVFNVYPRRLRHPLWLRYRTLSYGLRGGYSRLDFTHLWRVIPQEWPELRRELMELWELPLGGGADDGSEKTG